MQFIPATALPFDQHPCLRHQLPPTIQDLLPMIRDLQEALAALALTSDLPQAFVAFDSFRALDTIASRISALTTHFPTEVP